MSGKYAFSKAVKEIRFHLCQKGEGSAAARYVQSARRLAKGRESKSSAQMKAALTSIE